MIIEARAIVTLLLAASAGLALGVLHFGGLWWTTRRLARSRHPVCALFASRLVRSAFLIAGVLAVGRGRSSALAACLVGIILARGLACRWWGTARVPAASNGEELRG